MDFKTIFLDHFQKCLNEGSGIETAALRDIASGDNASAANAALKELMQEGIVASIPEVDADKINMPISECNKFKLTEKGIDFIKQRSAGYEQKNKFLYIDAYLSAYEKILKNLPHEAIKNEQKLSDLQDVVRRFSIALEQYKSILNNTQWATVNNAKALRDLQAHMPTFDASALDMRSSFTPKQIRQIADTYASIGDIVKGQYSGKSPKAISSFLDEVDKAQKKITGSEDVPKIKTAASGEENTKTFTFEGILGQNCGNVVATSSGDEKRIQVKGFKVNDGIRVLRGFAKASELYEASEPDIENYQRKVNEPHIEGLKEFISKINAAGKYLPELTFVARGGYELFRPEWGWQLRGTQLGNFKNLEFYKIKFDGKKLYRIDGNHRLEALYQLSQQGQEYYIPFSIILYGKQVHFIDPNQEHELDDFDSDGSYAHVDDEEAKRIKDNEAFLFYFLNAKAKRLTTEENYKGLVGANWQDHEISIANHNIVLLKHLNLIIKENILSYNFCNNEPLKQITEILDKINEPIDSDSFKEIIRRTNDLLAKDHWEQLKKFCFYCQLIFYIAYKHSDINECSAILDRLENWVKKYNFDNTTFDDPILLYNNAAKTNNLDPINIFVAMPYDKENIGNFTAWINNAINRLDGKYAKYKDRLKLNPIMSNRGYALDLMDNIMNEIDQCGIFIAEISPCVIKDGDQDIKCDANPNVMYELGIAYNLRKPIILMREEIPFTKKVPSDIQEKYRIGYKRSNTRQSQQDIQDAIKSVLDNFFE